MYPLSQNMIENSDLNQKLKFILYRTVTNNLNRINLEDDRVKEIYTFNESLNYFLSEKFYIENTKIYIDEIAKEDLDGYKYLEYSYKIEPIDDDYIKWYYKNDDNKLINPRTYNENPSEYWYGSRIIKYNISGNSISFSK